MAARRHVWGGGVARALPCPAASAQAGVSRRGLPFAALPRGVEARPRARGARAGTSPPAWRGR